MYALRCARMRTPSAKSRWCSIRGTSTGSRKSRSARTAASTPSCNCACIRRSRPCASASPPSRTASTTSTSPTSPRAAVGIRSRGKATRRKSGGIATNIGIHLFDMLVYVFGAVHAATPFIFARRSAPPDISNSSKANVRWFLSIAAEDLPKEQRQGKTTWRSIKIDGSELEFSDGFTDLHTRQLSRKSSPAAASGSMTCGRRSRLLRRLRKAPIEWTRGERHPLASRAGYDMSDAGAATRAFPASACHESAYIDDERRDRRRHDDLALLPCAAGHCDRPQCHRRPKRHGRAQCSRSATTARSKTTSRSTKASSSRPTSFAGRAACSPTSSIRAPHVSRKAEFRKTLVKRGATIGANATILCGITIGEFAFIGAGAVVTRDVVPHALMVGAPARRTGWMSRAGEKLGADLTVLARASVTRLADPDRSRG